MNSKILFVLLILILGITCVHIREVDNHATEEPVDSESHAAEN